MKLTKVLGILAILVVGVIVLVLAAAILVYPPEYVYRVLVWQDSDAFDWQKFPAHPLDPAPTAYHFDMAPDPRVEELFKELSGAEDWNSFLETNGTQAFIVVQDGAILYENYFNHTQRDSIVTSFSVAKSFGSALIGIALQEGYIKSVNDPITTYLPELAERDPRFNEITIRHLLLMASGLEYKDFRSLLLNGDDPLTTYYPDQRKIALENTHITDPPGLYFQYNKYHPQLLGMILERTTGMPVTNYLQTRIWDKLGMEYGGSWSTDSQASDFEKMETGVNARAIDFAKFGVLYLNHGLWDRKLVIPITWVDESTQPLLPKNYSDYYNEWVKAMPGQGYYKYMWWGMAREGGSYDFTAEGDKGQFIYVSPEKNMVIVRNGVKYGIPSQEWLRLFYEFASQY
ncbi:MAG: serine hydrolase [Anaerolineales bacterium]|jgi:CubicO group peptidase (beta-lactamase class C family)